MLGFYLSPYKHGYEVLVHIAAKDPAEKCKDSHSHSTTSQITIFMHVSDRFFTIVPLTGTPYRDPKNCKEEINIA